MKFGKRIQAQQVPGWSPYYLDYKFLKKIISSLAANRPASEAAALALGVRPPSSPQPLSHSRGLTPTNSPFTSPGQPPFFAASNHDANRGPDFQAHKAAFFFKLERELEKINAFYLQKEAELKLRMETLLSKRRAAAIRGLPDNNSDSPQNRAEWSAVEEGFRLLERDLGKLQQFVEINGEGFRKILKKYDKRSTSTTKELYLARQVDIQPVFNRQLISELANTVATCLLDITDLSSGLSFEGPNANDIFTQQILNERPSMGPFGELESNFYKAIAAKDMSALKDCVVSTDLLGQQHTAGGNITRMLWNVIIEAPTEFADFILGSLSSSFDYHFVDDINGRTCLHEAAIAGVQRLVDLCLRNGVPINKSDVYGRTALHYAAMKGHAEICRQLLKAHITPNSLDRDNYSPLVYATAKGNVDCVRVLLEEGRIPAQSPTSSGDLSPLSIAAQAGHVDVVRLLLKHNATSLPNTNGEYPMHLAAQKGHVEVCKLLLSVEGWDKPDKYHEWTPLFHAARHGHSACVSVLLSNGANHQLRDEFDHLAAHYAAWYGQNESLALLLLASKDDPPINFTLYRPLGAFSPEGDMETDPDIDMIPSLSLPPPIMPHRGYGHNYLVNSHLVQIFVGQWSRYSPQSPSVRLHHRLISPVFKDEYLLNTSPLKLVMTTSSNVNPAPYSMTLPPQPGEGYFTFKTPTLENLTLEFSVYPNFGTKTIGRAVALPSVFAGVQNNQMFTLPILDHRLHTIGEIDFQANVIEAFQGVTLEIGGDVETYWKSTEIASVSQSGYSGQTPASASSNASPAFSTRSESGGLPLTHSSLHGNYLHVVVQVTRDLHPVVYSNWLLPSTVSELGVADVTLEQFEKLAKASGCDCELTPDGLDIGDYRRLLATCMLSLEYLLKTVPTSYSIVLELAYPATGTIEQLNLGRRLHLNSYVDAVLRTIYGVSAGIGTADLSRKVAFLSFAPDVCAAVNWKQPNYPVFFASECGGGTGTGDSRGFVGSTSKTARGSAGDDLRTCSIGAAVQFAKSNNLLGIFIDADLLIRVPSTVDGIRSAELIVGVLGSPEKFSQLTSDDNERHAVDAYFDDGIVSFIDRSTKDLM